MTLLNKILTGATTLAVVFMMNSCQKEKSIPVKGKTAIDKQFVSKVQNALKTFALPEGAVRSSGKNSGFDGCATITIDSSGPMHKRTIVFGPNGCFNSEGELYGGTLVVEYNGENMELNGFRRDVVMTNFTINGREIVGAVVFENRGNNGNGNMHGTFIGSATIHDPVNGDEQIDINQTIEWVNGQQTQDKEDDVIATTGYQTTTNVNGNIYAEIIQEELIAKRLTGCSDFYVKGVLLIQETGQADKLIDYGDGTCDDLATETVDGQSQVITLQ